MRKASANKLRVTEQAVASAVAFYAEKFSVGQQHIRNTRCQDPNAILARHAAWRSLATPNTSIISIARAWPCHHTTILDALNGRKRARK